MSVTCFLCDKVFSKQNNLNTHLKNIHNQIQKNVISFDYNVYNHKCLECHVSLRNLPDLRYHLQISHKVKMLVEQHEFTTRNEFMNWYNDLCASENVQYTHNIKNNVEYFNCNRSGKVELKEDRQRAVKSQGSCKLNYSCTSQIIMKNADPKLNVTYYKTHYGHLKDVQHLRISQKDRTAIAVKLANGVSMKRLLDDNRDNIQGNTIKRIHLLTKKDLQNVKSVCNIQTDEEKRYENDYVNVDLWIAEQRNSPHNCVLFYKKQGEEMEKFKTEDFCLIIMNASQKFVLQNYGSNIVTIDSTHGLSSYDFHLTTLMVLDDYNEKFPAACMFSNRQDTYIFELFFSTIKKEVGVISCRTFMSDITDVCYNAWIKIMHIPTHRLFCAWHVDRAWQVHINKIQNVEKRTWIYQTVKLLQTTLDKDEFTDLLESYTRIFLIDKDTSEFGHYFKNHYYNNVQSWAYCFRKDCGINTNMRVDSMHKVIKYFDLEGKNVQDLDRGLHAVLNFIRDKVVERVIKNSKGKSTRDIQIIAKHHRLSLTVKYNTDVIDSNDDNIFYKVDDDTNHYIVKRILENPCCKTMCTYCNICIHCYTCQCADYNEQHTICKHIHYIDLKFHREKENFKLNEDLQTFENSVHLQAVSENYSKISKGHSLNSLKDKIESILQNVKEETNSFFEKYDYSSLDQLYCELQEVKSLITILKSNKNSELTLDDIKKRNRVKREQGIKKISKQETFKSRKNVKRVLRKPNEEDIELIKSIIPLF